MAVAKMTKVMIVSHRSEVGELLERIQQAGIMQILDAERAMVTKEWPELNVETSRHKDIEETITKLDAAIEFLSDYLSSDDKPSMFKPLKEVEKQQYTQIISGKDAMELMYNSIECRNEIQELQEKIDHNSAMISSLEPWKGMDVDVREIKQFDKVNLTAGKLPLQSIEDIMPRLEEAGAIIEAVNETKTHKIMVVGSLNEDTGEIGKILRSGDFESFSFVGMEGTVDENIEKLSKELDEYKTKLGQLKSKAEELAKGFDMLGVLSDHYTNLLNREKTRSTAPATTHAILLEGWVKRKDLKKAEKMIEKFSSTSISEMPLGEDEETPVEIDNNKAVKPFETITRLHGMPNSKEGDVDPTAFLAPFFALFFGLCLTDAGYGIIMSVAAWWMIKKLQGDKKAIWMFLTCSLMTIIAGAITGSWFGDTVQALLPAENGFVQSLESLRTKMMLFDPMKEPMTFFIISIGLGYVQIMFALLIGFFNNLNQKDYATAIFNFLVWIIFINALIVFGVGKAGMAPAAVGSVAGWVSVIGAVLIFWFSERNSGMAGRIGGGVFSLFSTVFYFGDVLSYVRLMALGMVTAGLGMAVNILVQLLMDVPYVGFLLGAILFVAGHTLNMALSILSAFVHSLRLQFVEFFPKFFTGGGRQFEPLALEHKHALVKEEKQN